MTNEPKKEKEGDRIVELAASMTGHASLTADLIVLTLEERLRPILHQMDMARLRRIVEGEIVLGQEFQEISPPAVSAIAKHIYEERLRKDERAHSRLPTWLPIWISAAAFLIAVIAMFK